MIGKIIAQVISVFIFVYMALIGMTFILHITVTERINDICYDVAETISTQGILSEEIYDYLCENVSRYGDCKISLMLKNKEDTAVTYCFGAEEIINVPLNTGDRVIIGVSCIKQSLLERLTGSDSSIAAVKTAVVG